MSPSVRFSTMFTRLTLLLAYLAIARPGGAAETRPAPLAVELLSECDTLRPGQTLHLGVRQTIAPGYHSYWRNPGTVGMPMQLAWELPDGYSAGEVLWPLPETGKMAAYTIWGYHDSALLVVPIRVPSSARPGEKVTLKATASWMCCAKTCHPDTKPISITLPIGENSRTNHIARAAIASTLAEQPRADAAWSVKAVAKGDSYHLTIRATHPATHLPTSARFYDYDRQISSDKGQQTTRSDRLLRVRLSAEEHTGEQLPRLRGMLVADEEWRPGLKALAVDIPITRNP